jgi:hypothetical protein
VAPISLDRNCYSIEKKEGCQLPRIRAKMETNSNLNRSHFSSDTQATPTFSVNTPRQKKHPSPRSTILSSSFFRIPARQHSTVTRIMAPVMIWERKKERKKIIMMEDTGGRRVRGTIPRRGEFLVLILMNDDEPLVYPSSSLPSSLNQYRHRVQQQQH